MRFGQKWTSSTRSLVGPSRQPLGLSLGRAPEHTGALEVSSRVRNLSQAGDRVQGPEPVLLIALEDERCASLLLGFVQVATLEGKNE